MTIDHPTPKKDNVRKATKKAFRYIGEVLVPALLWSLIRKGRK